EFALGAAKGRSYKQTIFAEALGIGVAEDEHILPVGPAIPGEPGLERNVAQAGDQTGRQLDVTTGAAQNSLSIAENHRVGGWGFIWIQVGRGVGCGNRINHIGIAEAVLVKELCWTSPGYVSERELRIPREAGVRAAYRHGSGAEGRNNTI